MPNEDEDLMKFEISFENLYFVVYDLKWSFTISYVNRLGRKSKNWKLTELIDQGFMRMLYGLIREVRKLDLNINWDLCGGLQNLEQLEKNKKKIIQTNYQEWKSKIYCV